MHVILHVDTNQQKLKMSQRLLKDTLKEFECITNTGNTSKVLTKKQQKKNKLQKSKKSDADNKKFIEIYQALRYNNGHLVHLKKAHEKVYRKKTSEKKSNNKKKSVFTEEDFQKVGR